MSDSKLNKLNGRLVTCILTDGEQEALDLREIKRLGALSPEEIEAIENGTANTIITIVGTAELKYNFNSVLSVTLYKVTAKTATTFSTSGVKEYCRFYFDLDRLMAEAKRIEAAYAAYKKKNK